jgi:hypothetical protein
MRAVVGCAVVCLLLIGATGRADDALPLPRFGEPSCEEQCRQDGVRDDASCDAHPLREGERALCHDAVRARVAVCLRICED